MNIWRRLNPWKYYADETLITHKNTLKALHMLKYKIESYQSKENHLLTHVVAQQNITTELTKVIKDISKTNTLNNDTAWDMIAKKQNIIAYQSQVLDMQRSVIEREASQRSLLNLTQLIIEARKFYQIDENPNQNSTQTSSTSYPGPDIPTKETKQFSPKILKDIKESIYVPEEPVDISMDDTVPEFKVPNKPYDPVEEYHDSWMREKEDKKKIVDAKILGTRPDLLIIDDMVDPDLDVTKAVTEKLKTWFDDKDLSGLSLKEKLALKSKEKSNGST